MGLNNEKKKNSDFVGLQTIANELKNKNISLFKENKELTAKLTIEMNKNIEFENFKNIYNDFRVKNELQIRAKNKLLKNHKNEVFRLKSSFNKQLIALRKQSYYYEKCNEIDASFYLF